MDNQKWFNKLFVAYYKRLMGFMDVAIGRYEMTVSTRADSGQAGLPKTIHLQLL